MRQPALRAGFRGRSVSLEDVLLDWAVAEGIGETYANDYRRLFGNVLWRRLKVEGTGAIPTLKPEERTVLLNAVRTFRSPILMPLMLCSRFRLCRVAARDIKGFSVIAHFHGVATVGELVAAVRAGHFPGFGAKVQEIIEAKHRGQEPHGSPIATHAAGAPAPMLVEGYKRIVATLWTGVGSLKLYLCEQEALPQ